jgi:hypothetical protein
LKEHRRAEMVLNNIKADIPSLRKHMEDSLIHLNSTKREIVSIKGILT